MILRSKKLYLCGVGRRNVSKCVERFAVIYPKTLLYSVVNDNPENIQPEVSFA